MAAGEHSGAGCELAVCEPLALEGEFRRYPVFRSAEYMREHQHEHLMTHTDPVTGLRAIVAIHKTRFGRAIGGVRLAKYNSTEEAERDVLRLSEGMTYKAALARVPYVGAKAVIISDALESDTKRRSARFYEFGHLIERLGGKYITAEDVGTTTDDMVDVRKATRYVAGLPKENGGGGDPSPMTAAGVIAGTEAVVQDVLGVDTLAGLTFAIQGLGKVGAQLAEMLVHRAGRVIAADVREDVARAVGERLGIVIVDPEVILASECDILVPCAMGGVINDRTIEKLRCRTVAGCANNQLEEERHGEALHQLGIIYAVDYALNAGGLINCVDELEPGGYSYERALQKTLHIGDTLRDIVRISRLRGISTQRAAREMALVVLGEADEVGKDSRRVLAK